MSSESENPFSPDAIKKIIEAPAAQRRTEPGFYDPRYQDFYGFENGEWKKGNTSNASLSSSKTIRVLKAPTQPTIILLQEMLKSDIKQIVEAPWIRERFFVTDIDNSHWLNSYYATTTLIDRRLNVKSVFRVPLVSKFERDGFFVDIALSGSSDNVVRFCNAHLESLVADPPVRPQQLADVAPYLRDARVTAGLLAGDCNAIQSFDRTLHTENGLKDAYLKLGGEEDSDEGYTWGYQVKKEMRERFGPSRMDKVMYCGAMEPKSLKRIGIGVGVEDEAIKEQMVEELEGDWVTDHYGLEALMEITGGEVELRRGFGAENVHL